MTQLGEIQYVPRKSITRFRLNGYTRIPGDTSPVGWAVPMQYVGHVVEEPKVEPVAKPAAKTCGCEGPKYARGMCYRHWYRWRQG